MADPELALYSGTRRLAFRSDFVANEATVAKRFGSPLTGDSRNAAHVFIWTYATNVTPANDPFLLQVSDASGSGARFCLGEVHDLDATSPRPPVVYVPPFDTSVALGSTLGLSVLVGGESEPTVQWQHNGVDIVGATGTIFLHTRVSDADSGSYRVRVTSAAGTTLSMPANVTVFTPPPTITVQPQAAQSLLGRSAALSITAAGPGLSYQWLKDGVLIPGATSSSLVFAAVTAADAGVYTVSVTNSAGSLLSERATLTVVTNPGRLVNVSLRAFAGTGERTLTLGFALEGPGGKRVVIRGVGPSLTPFAVSNPLSDPRLGIYVGATEILANDNWTGADGSDVGGFPLPVGSSDAVVTNSYSAQTYTAQVTGVGGRTGEALIELYDGASGNVALRLVNLSARSQLGDGERLIVGFTLTGADRKRLIIRAVGPGLAQFGVVTAHADPSLELYSANGVKLAENDQWSGDDGRTAGAFPLVAGSKDAVIAYTFDPAGYSVHVKGPVGTSGVVLIEIYDAP